MSSSRLILIFLAFIFLIIIVLSSARIGNALRSRFGKFIPSLNPTGLKVTPTPTPPIVVKPTVTPTPTFSMGSTNPTGSKGTNGKIQSTAKGGTTTSEIPATGPSELAYLLLGGSFFTGFSLKKISPFIGKK